MVQGSLGGDPEMQDLEAAIFSMRDPADMGPGDHVEWVTAEGTTFAGDEWVQPEGFDQYREARIDEVSDAAGPLAAVHLRRVFSDRDAVVDGVLSAGPDSSLVENVRAAITRHDIERDGIAVVENDEDPEEDLNVPKSKGAGGGGGGGSKLCIIHPSGCDGTCSD